MPQSIALSPRAARYQRAVVVRTAALFALLPPLADVAVLDRLRVGLRRLRGTDEALEACACLTIVREVVERTAFDGRPQL